MAVKVLVGDIFDLTREGLPSYDAVATDPPWGQGKATYFANLAHAGPMRFVDLIRALARLAEGKPTLVLMGKQWVADVQDIFKRRESMTLTCRYGQRPCTLIAFAPAWVPPFNPDVSWRAGMKASLEHLPANSVVLDPFAGRGSIGKLCERIGLEYLGIELNPGMIA